ncbi:MAG TPA: hypothetical protein VFE73_21730 [Reyranella sp.]|jgi:hypothetical protein|nr:hypothetical protein [Reyranella sp.]
MATDTSPNDEPGKDKNFADRNIPNPSDVLGLMVSVQRFHTQLIWQMGEVMADMMSMPLGRDREEGSAGKRGPLNRCVSDLKDAIDGATEILQQGGKPR